MRVAVIGGAGRLGSAALAAIARRGSVSDLTLTDGQRQLAEAEVRDLGDALADTPARLSTAEIHFAAQSDVIVYAGGASPVPGETPRDLARRNLPHFLLTLEQLSKVGLREDVVVVVAAEPAELLTHFAQAHLGLAPGRILGRGAVIDARRLRVAVARELELAPGDVTLTAIGGHGEDTVPLWSGATVGGVPLATLTGWTGHLQGRVETALRRADADLLTAKGGGWLGPGEAIADIVDAIARDARVLLPVCIPLRGTHGLRQVTLALPTPVGRSGAGEPLAMKLWPKESNALRGVARRFQADLRALTQKI